MRALIYLLVFANLAFFAYTRLVGSATNDVAEPTGPAVARLRLQSEVPVVPKICTTTGPFTSEDSTNRAAARLGASARLRTTEVAGPSQYTVEVHAHSAQDASRLLARLRKDGVRDAELPATGSSTVLFGRYDTREAAQRRLAGLAHNGVSPVLIEHAKKVPQWWIDTEAPAGTPAPDLAELAGAVGETGVLGAAPCGGPVVAPPAAVPVPPAAAPAGTPDAPPAPAGATKPGGTRPANA